MAWMVRSGVGGDSGGNRVMLFITRYSPVVVEMCNVFSVELKLLVSIT